MQAFVSFGRRLQQRPVLAFVILAAVLFPVMTVSAQATSDGIGGSILRAISSGMFILANIAIRVTVFSLELFLELASYNNFVNSPPVIIGWFMVRDLANMFFIVVLLVIAFATVLGLEQYEWKKTLGKLILAAILINFSKLIMQLIIDVANVFTVTFLNAVKATAAGNLINMFNFDTMLNIRNSANPSQATNLEYDLFGTSVVALVLSLMSMFVMGAYMIILVVRIVVLWVLMILSPLAFLLQAIPSTKKYADEFWSEFTKHVMVAPLMTFFLWLTFATLGNGNIATDIGINTSAVQRAGTSAPQIPGVSSDPSVALSGASTWESLSSFIISLAFLVIGIMAVQRLNVKAGGLAGGALDFGKKVATIASGYALGRAIVDKGAGLGLGVAKGVGYRVPFVGGAALQKYGAGIKQQFKQKGVAGLVGKEYKGKLSKYLGGNVGKIAAVDRAKEWEKRGDLRGWVMARISEPTERVTKMKEDYEKAIEHDEYVLAESLSTSGTRAGQIKLNALVERKGQEAIAEHKAANKLSSRISEAQEANKVYHELYGQKEKDIKKKFKDGKISKSERDKEIAELRTSKKTVEAVENAVKARVKARKEDVGKFERTLAADGGMKRRLAMSHNYLKKMEVAQGEKASNEQLSIEQEDLLKGIEAAARDDLLIKQNEDPRFVALEEERKKKRYEEDYAGKTYGEAVHAPKEIAKALQNPTTSDKERNKLLNRMAASLNYNMGQGAEQGMEAFGNALEELGTSYDEMLAEGFNEQEMLMAVLSGQNLNEKDEGNRTKFRAELDKNGGKGIDDVHAKWQKDVGGDKTANAILRGLDNAIKKTTADGGVAMAGIFNGDNVVQGQSQMKLQANPAGAREYFAERQNLSTLTDVNQIAGRDKASTVVLDKKGNIVIDKDTGKPKKRYKLSVKEPERRAMFVDTFKSMTKNTRLTSAMTASLTQLRKDIDEAEWGKLLGELSNEAKDALTAKVPKP